MNRLRAISIVVVVGTAVAGCGGDSSSGGETDAGTGPESTAPPTVSSSTTWAAATSGAPSLEVRGGADGPVVYGDRTDSGTGEEALIAGTLQLVDECLLISLGPDSSDAVTVIWRADTRWDPQTSEVILPGGSRLAPGDGIEAGGGYHSIGELGRFLGDGAAIDDARVCADRTNTRSVFVIQHAVEV